MSTTMRALAVLPSQREVRLIECPMPAITGPGELKIRSLEVGICGTDREICAFIQGSPPLASDYLVLGHESLGEVVEVGADVAGFKPGDLVVPSVRRPCPHARCRPCRGGQYDYCLTGDFVERGIKRQHGFMTEYFVDEQGYFSVVPADLREVAVLTEPLTIAEKAIAQVWQVQGRLPWACAEPGRPPGHGLNAVVLGAGPIGILGAMALRVRGFNTCVYSRDLPANPKSDLVEALGIPYVSTLDVTPDQLAERVGNIDVVYEAIGGGGLAFDIIRVLGSNGVFVFTGIPSPERAIDQQGDAVMRNIVWKNQAVIGTVNADGAAFASAIRDLREFKRRWPAPLNALITGRHALDDYQKVLLGPNQGIKHVIQLA